LSFYFQALVHLALGDGLGQARFASALAGLVAVYLVYDLGRIWFDDRRGALWAAAFYLFSRPFLFPATMARPDMLATALGLGAVWWVARWGRNAGRGVFGVSGIAAGLSLLAHPLGVVPATQVGVWILLTDPARGGFGARVRAAALYTATALATFGLWGLMIVRHPDLFAIQFGGNVWGRATPGVGRTLLAPGAVLHFQLSQIGDLAGPLQAGLYILGIGWSLFHARRPGRGREFLFHAAAAWVLLFLCMGRHPIRAYYVYPAAFASIAVGMLGSSLAGWLAGLCGSGWPVCRKTAPAVGAVLLTLALLPGSGLRTLEAHLRHWNDPHYRSPAFARAIMADIPAHALVAVDRPYVLDFFLADRRVVEAMVEPFYYDVRAEPFVYVVLGTYGLEHTKPHLEGLELVKAYGDQDDPLGNYAELYRCVFPGR
jgi:4-amino-4-deoxy-L-arabinose transferase-like glycosyltransferase